MSTLLAILQLIPAIIAAVRAVEEAVPIEGQGKAKLDLILAIVKAVYDGSRDLQKQFNWPNLLAIVVAIVEKIVAVLNATGVFQTAKKAVDHA